MISRSLLRTLKRFHFKNTEHKKPFNPTVFLNLKSKSGNINQKIEVELYENKLPVSTENFKKICEGYKNEEGNQLSYEGVKLKVDQRKILLTSEYILGNIYNNELMLHENYDGRFIYAKYNLK